MKVEPGYYFDTGYANLSIFNCIFTLNLVQTQQRKYIFKNYIAKRFHTFDFYVFYSQNKVEFKLKVHKIEEI